MFGAAPPPQSPSGSPPLPPGYTAQWSEQYQRYFYVNTQTGQSQWDMPQPQGGPLSQPPGPPPAGGQLDKGMMSSMTSMFAGGKPQHPQQQQGYPPQQGFPPQQQGYPPQQGYPAQKPPKQGMSTAMAAGGGLLAGGLGGALLGNMMGSHNSSHNNHNQGSYGGGHGGYGGGHGGGHGYKPKKHGKRHGSGSSSSSSDSD
ncbi:hypothetical protein HDU98_010177 [Podochytrium sp. JEL0797]|nr:hypothetical protein HDU98_010177 [Podochytrium sp. JEL0797]